MIYIVSCEVRCLNFVLAVGIFRDERHDVIHALPVTDYCQLRLHKQCRQIGFVPFQRVEDRGRRLPSVYHLEVFNGFDAQPAARQFYHFY